MQIKNSFMSLGSQFEQRRVEYTLTLSLVALAVSTYVILAIIPVLAPVHPPSEPLSASVFSGNSEVSSGPTVYIFTFKTTTPSAIKAIEITSPSTYDVKQAGYIFGSDEFKYSSFETSGSKMKLVFQQPIDFPAGTASMIEIGGISNPSAPGWYRFTIATIDSSGNVASSGSASIMLREPSILQNSIQTDHIQDEAITGVKVADGSINLNKLASDAISLFNDQISALRQQISTQVNTMQTELGASLESEESARMGADIEESSARLAADENIREEIDSLRKQIEALEGQIESVSGNN